MSGKRAHPREDLTLAEATGYMSTHPGRETPDRSEIRRSLCYLCTLQQLIFRILFGSVEFTDG